MAVTFQIGNLHDITVYVFAAHHIREGEDVRCFLGIDGRTRARRPVGRELPSGTALHDAGPGMPLTVVVLRRGNE